MLSESGDAPQEFFDRHISKVRHAVSGVNEAWSEETLYETPRGVNKGLDDGVTGSYPGRAAVLLPTT